MKGGFIMTRNTIEYEITREELSTMPLWRVALEYGEAKCRYDGAYIEKLLEELMIVGRTDEAAFIDSYHHRKIIHNG